MPRQKKSDIETLTAHKFYSTDIQYERIVDFSCECGITVSQFLQKVADILQNDRDKACLMDFLQLEIADSLTQKKLRDQRADRTECIKRSIHNKR